MTGRTVGALTMVLATVLGIGTLGSVGAQQATRQDVPIFRAGIDVVSVSATVRDRKGRVVRDLVAKDFQVFVKGRSTPIVGFEAGQAGAVSLALLVDVSGSMRQATHVDAVRQMAEHLLGWFEPRTDEAAVFAFDKDLYQLQPFTNDRDRLRGALAAIETFGLTSLYDAVAQTARQLTMRDTRRRAIVLLTDGIDTSSQLTPAQVAGVAGAIDVPVYVIALLSPLDNPGSPNSVGKSVAAQQTAESGLRYLAEWTGGEMFEVSAPAQASLAARQVIGELRYQYLLAIESVDEPGWHPLDIRLRRPNLTVRARGGYLRAS